MEENNKDVAVASQIRKGLPGRVFRWLDRRTGVEEVLKHSLDEPIHGGARFAYVFGSGLLYIFISQIITGLCLALYYVPSAETAHTSVAYITKQVAAGAFIRSLHYYGASAMIIVLVLHFLQTFLYGSFKGRRELLWISGGLLSLMVLAMGFTGYLLPWDQNAYFATAVGTNIVAEIPFIGNWLNRLLRGGDTIGTLTLSRFYVAHVFLIPGIIFAFIGAHIVLFQKAGPAGPINEDPIQPKLPSQPFYPRQVFIDMTFAFLLMVVLGIISYFHPEGLGPVANPADTQFLPRPEWYYLSMFEWLKYWEGPKVVFAVVVIPGLLAAFFFLMPFLDRGLERNPWRRPIPVLAVAIVIFGMIFLGVRSHLDDRHDPGTVAQLTLQEEQQKAYDAAPFAPYVESPGGVSPVLVSTGPVNPLVAEGRGIFEAHGCSGCHGVAGTGASAPALTGITAKFPADQLSAVLTTLNPQMKAGHMPAVDISSADMAALVAYLGALGTSAAIAPAAHQAALPTSAANASEARLKPVALSRSAAASVDTGHTFFEQHGCSACHGPMGAGGRAPALAPLIAHQSDAQVIKVLKIPNAAMTAGGMQAVTATPEELSSLVAYLRSFGGVKPAAPVAATAPATTPADAAPPAAATAAVAVPAPPTEKAPPDAAAKASPPAGRALFVAQGCAACHGAAATGTQFAPTLVGVEKKFPGDALPALLRQPNSKMRAGGMPSVKLGDTQLTQLTTYLSGLDTAPPAASSAPVAGTRAAAASPRPPQVAAATPPSPLALRGKQVFEHNSCEKCHGAGGLHGTVAAPGLAGTASILPASTLDALLRHHSSQMQKGNMPLTNMKAQDLKAVIAFIRSMPTEDAAN